MPILKDINSSFSKKKVSHKRVKSKTIFDYLYLQDDEKNLIAKACDYPYKISIAPLQKGLSGAKTLLGRTHDKISNNQAMKKRKSYHKQLSKPYVFKIGKRDKIEYEYNQIKTIAEKIIQGFPPTTIAYSEDNKLAVLKQEFIGNRDGESLNLKKFIENASDYRTVIDMVNKVYNTEIINWISDKPNKRTKSNLKEQLNDWLKKIPDQSDFSLLVADLGPQELEKDIIKSYGLNYKLVQEFIKEIIQDTVQIVVGPVHGDLHAENILLDRANDNRISLIDFGWTDYRWRAVDFIWLECSLRYVVCSPSVSFNNYANTEDILDNHWGNESNIDYDSIEKLVHGKSLCKIIAGIATIRQNVRKQGVLEDLNDYRRGLILMSYGLMTLPNINKLYLLHTICNNIIKLKGRKRKHISQYDILYGATGILWPKQPGRMVIMAKEQFNKPGNAIDVGCGDGKNISYLKQSGWNVEGFDKSFLAISGANKRLSESGEHDIKLEVANVLNYNFTSNHYDLIVNYGLYHCLNDEEVLKAHEHITSALKPNGIMAFAMLNDDIPIPLHHGTTDQIYLRPEKFLIDLIENSFKTIKLFSGQIEEDHLPFIGTHKHSVTWALLKKN